MDNSRDMTNLETARAKGDTRGQADLLTRIGVRLGEEGRVDEALESLQEAYAIHLESGDDKRRLDLICRVCLLMVNHDRGDEAEQGLAVGMELARRINDVGARARLLETQARLALSRDRTAQAASLVKEAIDVCRTYRDRNGERRLTEMLASIYDRAGQWTPAAREYERAAGLASITKRPDRQAADLVRLAEVNWSAGQADQALDSIGRAEAICLENDQRQWAADLAAQRLAWRRESGK